ncbi:MAG: hypothetical protein IJ745_07390 [Bacteroidales bacterium]|nr:hypothetical protein [Bacteroidales bacterium]
MASRGFDIRRKRLSPHSREGAKNGEKRACEGRFAAGNRLSEQKKCQKIHFDFQPVAVYFARKMKKYFASLEKVRTFALAFEREKQPHERTRGKGPVVQFG